MTWVSVKYYRSPFTRTRFLSQLLFQICFPYSLLSTSGQIFHFSLSFSFSSALHFCSPFFFVVRHIINERVAIYITLYPVSIHLFLSSVISFIYYCHSGPFSTLTAVPAFYCKFPAMDWFSLLYLYCLKIILPWYFLFFLYSINEWKISVYPSHSDWLHSDNNQYIHPCKNTFYDFIFS